ncbi:kinase-like domain-containing protein [Syncephalis fuscata]|nr:kinase-like domain-containing protein [Syncephalis fuscata]
MIKFVLCAISIIAGITNVYANPAGFRAGNHVEVQLFMDTPIGDKDTYGQTGLTLIEVLGQKDSLMVAKASYIQESVTKLAILKCTNVPIAIYNELLAYNMLRDAPSRPNTGSTDGSQYIAQLYHDFPHNGGHCMVLSYGGSETIDAYVSSLDPFVKGRKIKKLFDKIVRAVAYLHHIGISHGDLSSRNILVPIATTAKEDRDIMIIDFDISQPLLFDSNHNEIPSKSRPGALQFLAPEWYLYPTIKQQKRDTFAIGAVLHHLLAGQYFYTHMMTQNVHFRQQIAEIQHGLKNGVNPMLPFMLEIPNNPELQRLKEIMFALTTYVVSKRKIPEDLLFDANWE